MFLKSFGILINETCEAILYQSVWDNSSVYEKSGNKSLDCFHKCQYMNGGSIMLMSLHCLSKYLYKVF